MPSTVLEQLLELQQRPHGAEVLDVVTTNDDLLCPWCEDWTTP